MKEMRVPTRQNQAVEILIFPVDALGPAILFICVGAALDSILSGAANGGFIGALIWLKVSVSLKNKGRGYIKHLLWNKGWLPRVGTRGIPHPLIRTYKR